MRGQGISKFLRLYPMLISGNAAINNSNCRLSGEFREIARQSLRPSLFQLAHFGDAVRRVGMRIKRRHLVILEHPPDFVVFGRERIWLPRYRVIRHAQTISGGFRRVRRRFGERQRGALDSSPNLAEVDGRKIGRRFRVRRFAKYSTQ
jgi:hypothetical protein